MPINIQGARNKGTMQDFSAVYSNRTMGNGHELKHRMLLINVHKNFTARVTEHWSRLSSEVVESPFLEALKSCLDTYMSNLF